MKILAIGDIHGDGKLAKLVSEKAIANNVDYIILTGDLTNSDKFDKGMIGELIKSNKKVMFVPGNHDSPVMMDVISEIYKIKNIHGYGFKTKNKDIGIFGCSSVNIGDHALSEDEIYEVLEKSHEQIKDTKKKILISHVHPIDTTIDKMGIFDGSIALKKAITKFKPDLLICSHIHEAKGIEEIVDKTKIINVAKEAKIIEF